MIPNYLEPIAMLGILTLPILTAYAEKYNGDMQSETKTRPQTSDGEVTN